MESTARSVDDLCGSNEAGSSLEQRAQRLKDVAGGEEESCAAIAIAIAIAIAAAIAIAIAIAIAASVLAHRAAKLRYGVLDANPIPLIEFFLLVAAWTRTRLLTIICAREAAAESARPASPQLSISVASEEEDEEEDVIVKALGSARSSA